MNITIKQQLIAILEQEYRDEVSRRIKRGMALAKERRTKNATRTTSA